MEQEVSKHLCEYIMAFKREIGLNPNDYLKSDLCGNPAIAKTAKMELWVCAKHYDAIQHLEKAVTASNNGDIEEAKRIAREALIMLISQ